MQPIHLDARKLLGFSIDSEQTSNEPASTNGLKFTRNPAKIGTKTIQSAAKTGSIKQNTPADKSAPLGTL